MLSATDLKFWKKTVEKMGYDSDKPFYFVGVPSETAIHLHITSSPPKRFEIPFEVYTNNPNNQENVEISFIDKFLCLLVETKEGEVYLSFFSDMDAAIYHMVPAHTSEVFGAFDPFVPAYKTVRFYYVPGNINLPLHLLSVGAIVNGITIESFGEVEDGKVVNRAVLGKKSDCSMHQYFDTLGDIDDVIIDEYWLNNLMEVGFYDKETEETRYTPIIRYATSFEGLALKVLMCMHQDEEPRVLFGGGLYRSKVDKASKTLEWLPAIRETIEDEWEHSQSYWKEVYKKGLAE